MSSNQPTSFRLPFNLPKDIHPQLHLAIRSAFSGIKDLNDAIASLNTKVNSNTSSVQSVQSTVNQVITGGAPPSSFPVLGAVNLQPNLSPGSYTLGQTDLAGLILINSSVAFALTLNSTLTLPFFSSAYNFGIGTVTVTPSIGNVNNLASIQLVTGQFAMFFMDPAFNWWALVSTSTNSLTVYANNAAALAGGLVAGELYRSGGDPDLVAVVH